MKCRSDSMVLSGLSARFKFLDEMKHAIKIERNEAATVFDTYEKYFSLNLS